MDNGKRQLWKKLEKREVKRRCGHRLTKKGAVCDTEKEKEISVQTLKKATDNRHSIDPFELFNWVTAESKKDTLGKVRKVEGDLEKSTEMKTEKSHKILQENTGISRGEGYIFERDPGGRSSLGSRGYQVKERGDQHEERGINTHQDLELSLEP